MEQKNVEFHIAEYTTLRSELSSLIRWTYLLVMYGVIANAFIIAWLATQATKGSDRELLYLIASWLPAIITVVAALIANDNIRAILRLGDYCVIVEKMLAAPDLGWQRYVRSNRKNVSVRVQHVMLFVFIAQILLSIAFGLYMTARL